MNCKFASLHDQKDNNDHNNWLDFACEIVITIVCKKRKGSESLIETCILSSTCLNPHSDGGLYSWIWIRQSMNGMQTT